MKSKITLYIEVGDVPEGQYVSKLNGSDKLKVHETLSIYQTSSEPICIKADEGTLF